MIKLFLHLVFFSLIYILQISFVSSLPWPISLTPLVFGVSVYLIQHHNLSAAAAWLVSYGFLLDYFGLGAEQFSTVSYGLGALLALLLSKKFFSNRSLYGVLGCSIVCFLVSRTIGVVPLLIEAASKSYSPETADLAKNFIVSLAMLTVLNLILFHFGKSVRKFLVKTFIISESQQTL